MAEESEARQVMQPGQSAAVDPGALADAVSNLRPALEKIRSGQFRVIVTGATSTGERDEARMFSVHLLELADALNEQR